jgi:hypothetical protein
LLTFEPVLGLASFNGLPLHVPGVICTAGTKRRDVVDYVTGAGAFPAAGRLAVRVLIPTYRFRGSFIGRPQRFPRHFDNRHRGVVGIVTRDQRCVALTCWQVAEFRDRTGFEPCAAQ